MSDNVSQNRKTDSELSSAMTCIAIIGAGISGLTVARRLARHYDVTVFEKSNGVGGRMATRYAGDFEFDHGAQFFTARTAEFQAFLRPMLEAGVVANWTAAFAELGPGRINAERQWDADLPHYVGVPRMNSIGRWLATDINICRRVEVARLENDGDQWLLFDNDSNNLGRFDWVILTVPAHQAGLLAPAATSIVRRAERTTMQACFALMLGFEEALEVSWEAALVREADISWLSLNSSKPGRGDRVTLVAHSTNDWADRHFNDDRETVKTHLVAECSRVTGIDAGAASHQAVHRWRFANIGKQTDDTFSIDSERRLAACGDWFVRGRVEAAFTSGNELASAMQEALSRECKA